jgi:hypothetical protein
MHGAARAMVSRRATMLSLELQRQATCEAAEMVRRDMAQALFCRDQLSNLDYAFTQKPPGGLIVEFGVYKGATITHIARRFPGERIFGFDSFQGLPDHWTGKRYSARNFDRKGVLPRVPANVELVVGWFEETLPSFLERHPGMVSFMHVDCDIYGSTNFVLTSLEDRLRAGSVIVFDEFFNYHGYQLHEFKAFREFIARTGRAFDYASYSGEQVTVILR